MARLSIHTLAEEDLSSIQQIDSVAAARIVVVLQEIQSDQKLLETLLDHNFGDDATESYHVSKWQEFWRKGLDLWRLKIWSLEFEGRKYRIVYAYDWRDLHFYVLGIVHRDFGYDPNDPRSQRILQAYADLR